MARSATTHLLSQPGDDDEGAHPYTVYASSPRKPAISHHNPTRPLLRHFSARNLITPFAASLVALITYGLATCTMYVSQTLPVRDPVQGSLGVTRGFEVPSLFSKCSQIKLFRTNKTSRLFMLENRVATLKHVRHVR